MSDNVAVTPGAGATIATDDVGGVQYQRVKVDIGGDGAAVPLVPGQAASAASIPVVVASDQSALAVSQSGTWTVQPGNTANTTAWKVDASSVAVPVTDNAGSLTVDYATTGSGTATGALRVELPTNGTGVLATLGTITNVVHVDDNAGSLTVDYATTGSGTATGALRVELPTNGTGVVGLNAGTNAIGKLTANSGVTIGAVELAASQTLGTLTTLTGGGVASGATDSGNPVKVGGRYNTTKPTLTDGQRGDLQLGVRGSAAVTLFLQDSTTTAGTSTNPFGVSVASGAIASGAVASGAVASGAFASGSIASGAIASGAIAAGAIAAGATSIAENEDVPSGDGDRGVKMLAVQKATPANTAGTDGDYEFLQISAGKLWVKHIGDFVTVSTDVTRPADANVYAVNDAWSDSTSAPTSGGYTSTSAARISGGSGVITDAIITSSAVPATTLQGEIWLFDTSVTNINDNAAFAVSDAEIKTYVGKIPFALEATGNNSAAHAVGLNIGFTCVGSANLRFLVKVKNAYTPASSEVLTVRLKIQQTN